MSSHEAVSGASRGRTGREIALTVGALAGLICILFAAGSMLFGIKPLVFRSGSMSPEITTGALALSRTVPAVDVSVGDIVSVVNDQGVRVSHRVYGINSVAGNSAVLTLKGDANREPDIMPYTVTEVDRIFFSVGGFGYAVSWLSGPFAVFLGGAFVGGLLVIAFKSPTKRDDDKDDGRSTPALNVLGSGLELDETQTRALTAVPFKSLMVVGAVALTAFGATQAVGTSAAFTDTAKATGSLGAGYFPAPRVGNVTCANSGHLGGFHYAARISWAHVAAPLSYRVLVRRDNGSVQTTINVSAGATPVGGTLTTQIGDAQVGDHTGWTYTAEVYTVNNGVPSLQWRGYVLKQPTIWNVECNSPANAAALQGDAARLVAPTTTTAGETTTTSAPTPTGTSTTAPTTTDVTTTTGPTTTTETSTSTTTQSTTPTTTTDATTTTSTTTKEAPVALGAAETSLTGYNATLMHDGASVAVVVTDSSGAEVSSTPVSVTATVMWQSDADELWIVDGANVYRVNAATGVSEKNPSGEAPAEIAAWIDGQK
ncbi:hypothetical protein QM716_04720 [Rhodococcus sp. IEGM 1409]|uniref:hypothetical protein n=1 Tax=Rhodococcus sp. IEGM 1409 TaxID=3047082 RepID=UPI0024B869F8|nr:hypothetical protein [Rhodococcus sp. IEGM 1409]MDI9899149.1 hypothetical protein [Rhodococcus sp. IEGM 1409]